MALSLLSEASGMRWYPARKPLHRGEDCVPRSAFGARGTERTVPEEAPGRGGAEEPLAIMSQMN